jgi:cytochrome oxidase Cu insertion factor (SCO1/SenC/PrrC family)/thiol-disulfide isomerase/thioredoxin
VSEPGRAPKRRGITRRGFLAGMSVLALLVATAAGAPAARADGDPGSDVLVYQPLFLTSDAGVSVAQQVKLGGLLQNAERDRFPVRVAIIATPQDLGAVTGLWRQPRAYARFLGIELSLAYRGRLLVVMPNGFGFNWPGHSAAAAYRALGKVPIRPRDLATAAQAGVGALAAASGVKLAGATRRPSAPQPSAPSAEHAAGRSGADTTVAIVAAALLVAAGLALLFRRLYRRGLVRLPPRPRPQVAALGGVGIAAGAAIVALVAIGPPGVSQSEALVKNPDLDPGTPLSRPAPGFTLTDQFGEPVSLASYRGKVVLLAFNDSECTTICPLTTTAMLDAKAMLGAAGRQVQLLGVDANPKATSLEDVLSYSQLHGMLHAWQFLTGSLPELQRVWRAYGVQAAVERGEVSHTPALFVIGPGGRLSRLYMTQQSYAAVGQLGQLLAQQASRLLPGHPPVHSNLSYASVPGTSPAANVTLPRAGGGSVRLGAGRARVFAFFATWDQQIMGLAGGLESLVRYDAAARRAGLPRLVAVDEASVEPPGALGRFLATLPHPLSYPVALDRSGRLGDGYEVQGLPWLMVVSASGRIAWYYSVATLGWPSTTRLIAEVREALAWARGAPSSANAAQAQLSGSPAALATLHRQAAQLIGSNAGLAARVRSLHGYPVVINAWASWCVPCQSEFGLFASASAHYGRQVAFLGADTDDSAGDARAFLAQHPVSYPSYQTTMGGMSAIARGGLEGLPTTIFISRSGKVVDVHTGQYDSQGTLDGDVESYALGG